MATKYKVTSCSSSNRSWLV